MSTSPVVPNPPPEPVEGKDPAEQTNDSIDPKPETVDVNALIAELKAELAARDESYKRQLDEMSKVQEHWFKQATGQHGNGVDAEAVVRQPEAETDIDADALVNAISRGDAKALKAQLKSLGLVDRSELDAERARVQSEREEERAAARQIAEMQKKHPELIDPSSELYEASVRYLEELQKDDALRRSPKLFEMAVTQARLELMERQTASHKSETREEEVADRGPTREARIGAQAAPTGKRRTKALVEEPLTEMQRLNAKRMGLSEETMLKHRNRLRDEGILTKPVGA